MSGWPIPPPSEPVKSGEDLRREREAKIAELERRGLLRSERLRTAMLTVRREAFIPSRYRDYAYEEVPLLYLLLRARRGSIARWLPSMAREAGRLVLPALRHR